MKEALKLALEALECATPHKIKMGDDDYLENSWSFHNKAIAAIKEALAQPQQELASASVESVSVTYKEAADAMNALYMGDSKQVQIAKEMENKKLYTTPQQRTWVGLTDERRIELAVKNGWGKATVSATLELSKAIEAELMEKNT